MKTILLLAVVLFAIQASNFAQSTSRVEGVAVDSKTDQPMEGVVVKLIPEGFRTESSLLGDSAIPSTLTDSQGHFTMNAIPGRYRVVPERNGFVFAYPPGV